MSWAGSRWTGSCPDRPDLTGPTPTGQAGSGRVATWSAVRPLISTASSTGTSPVASASRRCGEAADQGAERDASLEAGERCTEAVVDPVPEGQVRRGRAGDVENVRARQVGRVAVGGEKADEYGVPRGDRDAAQLERLGGHPLRRDLQRTVEPQELLDGGREPLGLGPQQRQLAGMGQQGVGGVGEQVHSGLVARDQQQDHQSTSARPPTAGPCRPARRPPPRAGRRPAPPA